MGLANGRMVIGVLGLLAATAVAQDRPNILWLTSEDHGPHLGCYGDMFASTPNVDRLAAKGMIYARCWSCAPVCAPARTTIISGMYPPSTGAEHMRSEVPMPPGTQMYPQILRAAGYYCTNNSKEDYNLVKSAKVWDESSPRAHYRNRAAGQPFFAVFNATVSHESQIRKRPHQAIHDPSKVRVPAYHPDTPEVRQDWAQYYDKVSEADAEAGKRLQELEESGLADDTIVFYYADHGSGMPRNKRWPYNSGLHVPLVVYFPDKHKHLAPKEYKPGGKSERLVSFIDLAPTVLSIAGIGAPNWMQGRAFAGSRPAEPPKYLFGFRNRMDERYDMLRSATDGQFVYVRNYTPHLPYGQHVQYNFETPSMVAWKRLHDEGKLNPAQERFWKPKPAEELYDLKADPDEVNNLAASAEYREKLEELRRAQQDLARSIRDIGFLPEAEMHQRAAGMSPTQMAHDETKYPFERVFQSAELASRLDPSALPKLRELCSDPDSAVRYWAALGMVMRGQEAVAANLAEFQRLTADPSVSVRIVAAHALAEFGSAGELRAALDLLLDAANADKHGVYAAMQALNAIDSLGPKAKPIAAAVARLPTGSKGPGNPRGADGVSRLIASVQRTSASP